MGNSHLLTPIITVIGILGGAYLTYLATTYQYRKKPKDPAEELFNYYDQLIKNMWEQNDRKDQMIEQLQNSIDKIQAELNATKALLIETKEENARYAREGKAVQQNIVEARLAISDKGKV